MSSLPPEVHEFVDDIARWRRAVASRAPSYHRVLHELVGVLEGDTPDARELAERFAETWAHRAFRVFYDRPLLFLASLRMDALVDGDEHPLWCALGAPAPQPECVTPERLLASLRGESVWRSLRSRSVQTNETSRAVAWLWPAELMGATGEGARPLQLFEVGAAAGLNLIADRLASPWKSASGELLCTAKAPSVLERSGIDASPLDACAADDAAWLRACVWAGETERLSRLEAAIEAFRASPARVQRGDVTEVPERMRALGAAREPPALVFAFQTIVRDYLDDAARASYERGMRGWLEDSPVATAVWTELEADHADPSLPVTLVAHARDGGGVRDFVLGSTGPHPAVVTVNDESTRGFARIFR